MKKRILSLMTALVLAAALCIPAAAADSSTLPFTDVPQTYWAYQSILFSYQNNLVKGKTETTFQPESPMALKEVKCYNPAFDVTNHELVTGIVTEKGICYPPYSESLKGLFE
jgi:Predicted translation initiation factor 2B subunit, eIF-2B alpha/beta/delta family